MRPALRLATRRRERPGRLGAGVVRDANRRVSVWSRHCELCRLRGRATALPDTSKTIRPALIALSVIVVVCLCRGLGSVALIDPDEGRNAAVGAAMAASGNWVVPHYNALPYLDKPVVLFATIAASTVLLGRTELAARLPSLLFTLATAFLLLAFGHRLFDLETGVLAAVVLLSCPLVFAFARIVIFDAVMMFWVTASLVGLYLALEEDSAAGAVAAWAGAGVAVLTKGPVGLVLPLLVGLAHSWAVARPLRRTRPVLGVLVFAAVVAPWFATVTAAHPEFPHYAFVRETFERVATDSMRRTGPPYYFVAVLVLGALPWIGVPLAAPQELRRWWRQRRRGTASLAYLMLCVLVPLAFFTLSQSKRAGYILPVFPALALAIAHLVVSAPGALRHALTAAAVLAAALGLAGLAGAGLIGARIDPAYVELVRVVPGAARACGAGLCATALLALWARHARRIGPAVAALTAFVLVPAVAGGPILAAVAEHRSTRALATAIRAAQGEASDAGEVVAIAILPPSLPFYLDRDVMVTTDDGSAVRSNYVEEYVDRLRKRHDSPLRPQGWWRDAARSCRRPTVFVVRTTDTLVVEALARQLPRVPAAGRYAAYGPCRPAHGV